MAQMHSVKYDAQIKEELATAKKMWPDSVETLQSEQLESLVKRYATPCSAS